MNWPRPHDIALGRGGMANNHAGNKAFRTMVDSYKKQYKETDCAGKKLIIRLILIELEENDALFVECDQAGDWVEAEQKKARTKVAQALRERDPQARRLRALASNLASNNAREDPNVVARSNAAATPNDDPDSGLPIGDNWVSVENPDSNSTDGIEDDMDFDIVPLSVDYDSIGDSQDSTHDLELDDEYVDVLLAMFGMIET